jgi:hypothetical protein
MRTEKRCRNWRHGRHGSAAFSPAKRSSWTVATTISLCGSGRYNLNLSKLMNLELVNKTALISGSTKGIGFSIASQLAAEGALVIVNGRSGAAVDATLEQIRTASRSPGKWDSRPNSGLTLEFTPSSTQMSTWQGSGMVSLQKVTKTFFRIHQISPKNRTSMSFAPPAVRRLFKTGRTGESKKQ